MKSANITATGAFIAICFMIFAFSSTTYAADEQAVNVYSARQENLIKPLLDRFTEATGIKVNLVTGKADALLARLQLEKEHSPADLLITTDAGRLHRAKAAKLLQCTTSPSLEKLVPEHYRDPNGCWYALSLRARTIMLVKDTLNQKTVPTYASLSNPQLRGKICIRSSSNIYNQSLVASVLAAVGEQATVTWLKGLTANFARPPSGGDRDQILAAAGGLCDIAIANTYYLAKMLASGEEQQVWAANKMLVSWSDQAGRGTHINVSGAGIIRTAPNPKNAEKLLTYLTSDEAQTWYAEANYEYPIRKTISIPEVLRDWGDFKADTINLSKLGELNTAAVKLMDKAGWP